MSTPDSFIDTLLDSSGSVDNVSAILDDETAGESFSGPLYEPGYEGKIDYRIRQLSYSSLLTLHTCPRKFQLYKLRTVHRTKDSEKQTVTFAYGHVVGEAIQLILAGATEEEVILHMFLGWYADLLAEDEKAKKSFWSAVVAAKRFFAIRHTLLADYELVYHDGKPACELSFVINFPDGFRYRGHVDAVLRHISTGRIMVLECKTTGSRTVNPATYKNSAQAIGYSIVLDSLFPSLSSYDVLYLIYQTHTQEYLAWPFEKTYLQRALWIRELLLDIEFIKMSEAAGVYKMHGESCFSFMRECEYINSCTMSTEFLARQGTPDDFDTTEYQVTLSLNDLLETQLGKIST
jgi:hypothetical protein